MLETWKSGRAKAGFRGPSAAVTMIAKAAFFSTLVGVMQPVAAAAAQAEHASNDKSKWIRICKADIQRFCDEANLKQECLVAHWSKISTECQDVLGSSAGNRAGDGS